MQDSQEQVGLESLKYEQSKVSWAISKHIASENPKLHRILSYLFVFIFMITLIYSIYTKVAISIMANGKIDYDASALNLLAPVDVTVSKIYFKDNELVKKNDLLLTTKNQINEAQTSFISKQATLLNELIELEENNKCSESCIQEIDIIKSKELTRILRFDLDSNFHEFINQFIVDLTSYSLSIKNVIQEPKILKGLNLRLTTAYQKINKIKAKKAAKLLAMEVEGLRKEIAEITSQISEKKNSNQAQVDNARSKLKLTLRALYKKVLEYKNDHEIRALQEGTLKYRSQVAVGQFLPARSEVFAIIPAQTDLMAKILIQNKDISEVKEGSKVKIAIQAIPEREFGAIYGSIKKISIDPLEESVSKGLEYEAIVELEKQKLTSAQGETRTLKLGMLVDAKIITSYKSLFRIAITKLLNIKDEYLGDLF